MRHHNRSDRRRNAARELNRAAATQLSPALQQELVAAWARRPR